MTEFWVSQPFFDVCGIYNGDGFDDFLKQVGVAYLDLDLSHITIDDTVPLTLGGDDTGSNVTIDSIHAIEQEVKDTDGVVIAQPTPERPNAAVVLFTMDPTTANASLVVNLANLDAPLS